MAVNEGNIAFDIGVIYYQNSVAGQTVSFYT